MNVECRSETAYAEKPVALVWEGERLEVAGILSRWRAPGQIHFRVRVTDGRLFELTYDEATDEWHIQFL
ncbi:MAG: hypothetical protein EHM81_06860 [Chloroflexi bacterium]|nr:MAG: hypothetical protein EHM81_06860 [Chloroflexota bacterium]